MGWTVRGSNPGGGGGDFSPVQTGPGAHPASCKMGTGSFPKVKCSRGVLLTTHPLLAPRSWKSRAIPLPTLWATNGVTLPFTYCPVFRLGETQDDKISIRIVLNQDSNVAVQQYRTVVTTPQAQWCIRNDNAFIQVRTASFTICTQFPVNAVTILIAVTKLSKIFSYPTECIGV